MSAYRPESVSQIVDGWEARFGERPTAAQVRDVQSAQARAASRGHVSKPKVALADAIVDRLPDPPTALVALVALLLVGIVSGPGIVEYLFGAFLGGMLVWVVGQRPKLSELIELPVLLRWTNAEHDRHSLGLIPLKSCTQLECVTGVELLAQLRKEIGA